MENIRLGSLFYTIETRGTKAAAASIKKFEAQVAGSKAFKKTEENNKRTSKSLNKTRLAVDSLRLSMLSLGDSKVNRVGGILASIATSVGAFGGFSVVSTTLAGVTAGLIAAGTAAATFEKEMARVAAITGEIGKGTFTTLAAATEALSEKSRELGKTTEFTANQVAQGLAFLAQTGFDANAQLQAIQSTLFLASAGELELGRAADIASNILQQFNLEAVETARVVDVLAKTATNSNTNIEQLANAMNFLAPNVATLGVSLEETAAVIGKLGDAGLQGTLATRAFGTSLARLADPSREAKTLIDSLADFEPFDELTGEFVGLVELVRQLEVSFAGLTDEQKLNNISILFGKEAIQEYNILLNEGSASLAAFATELEDSAGEAQRIAEIKLDTLIGDIIKLKSAFNELAIVIGEVFTDQLRTAVKGVTRFIGDLTTSIEEYSRSVDPVKAKADDAAKGLENFKSNAVLANNAIESLNGVTGRGGLIRIAEQLATTLDGEAKEGFLGIIEQVKNTTIRQGELSTAVKKLVDDYLIFYSVFNNQEGLRLQIEIESTKLELEKARQNLEQNVANLYEAGQVVASTGSKDLADEINGSLSDLAARNSGSELADSFIAGGVSESGLARPLPTVSQNQLSRIGGLNADSSIQRREGKNILNALSNELTQSEKDVQNLSSQLANLEESSEVFNAEYESIKQNLYAGLGLTTEEDFGAGVNPDLASDFEGSLLTEEELITQALYQFRQSLGSKSTQALESLQEDFDIQLKIANDATFGLPTKEIEELEAQNKIVGELLTERNRVVEQRAKEATESTREAVKAQEEANDRLDFAFEQSVPSSSDDELKKTRSSLIAKRDIQAEQVVSGEIDESEFRRTTDRLDLIEEELENRAESFQDSLDLAAKQTKEANKRYLAGFELDADALDGKSLADALATANSNLEDAIRKYENNEISEDQLDFFKDVSDILVRETNDRERAQSEADRKAAATKAKDDANFLETFKRGQNQLRDAIDELSNDSIREEIDEINAELLELGSFDKADDRGRSQIEYLEGTLGELNDELQSRGQSISDTIEGIRDDLKGIATFDVDDKGVSELTKKLNEVKLDPDNPDDNLAILERDAARPFQSDISSVDRTIEEVREKREELQDLKKLLVEEGKIDDSEIKILDGLIQQFTNAENVELGNLDLLNQAIADALQVAIDEQQVKVKELVDKEKEETDKLASKLATIQLSPEDAERQNFIDSYLDPFDEIIEGLENSNKRIQDKIDEVKGTQDTSLLDARRISNDTQIASVGTLRSSAETDAKQAFEEIQELTELSEKVGDLNAVQAIQRKKDLENRSKAVKELGGAWNEVYDDIEGIIPNLDSQIISAFENLNSALEDSDALIKRTGELYDSVFLSRDEQERNALLAPFINLKEEIDEEVSGINDVITENLGDDFDLTNFDRSLFTPEQLETLDGYIDRLGELETEYERVGEAQQQATNADAFIKVLEFQGENLDELSKKLEDFTYGELQAEGLNLVSLKAGLESQLIGQNEEVSAAIEANIKLVEALITKSEDLGEKSLESLVKLNEQVSENLKSQQSLLNSQVTDEEELAKIEKQETRDPFNEAIELNQDKAQELRDFVSGFGDVLPQIGDKEFKAYQDALNNIIALDAAIVSLRETRELAVERLDTSNASLKSLEKFKDEVFELSKATKAELDTRVEALKTLIANQETVTEQGKRNLEEFQSALGDTNEEIADRAVKLTEEITKLGDAIEKAGEAARVTELSDYAKSLESASSSITSTISSLEASVKALEDQREGLTANSDEAKELDAEIAKANRQIVVLQGLAREAEVDFLTQYAKDAAEFARGIKEANEETQKLLDSLERQRNVDSASTFGESIVASDTQNSFELEDEAGRPYDRIIEQETENLRRYEEQSKQNSEDILGLYDDIAKAEDEGQKQNLTTSLKNLQSIQNELLLDIAESKKLRTDAEEDRSEAIDIAIAAAAESDRQAIQSRAISTFTAINQETFEILDAIAKSEDLLEGAADELFNLTASDAEKEEKDFFDNRSQPFEDFIESLKDNIDELGTQIVDLESRRTSLKSAYDNLGVDLQGNVLSEDVFNLNLASLDKQIAELVARQKEGFKLFESANAASLQDSFNASLEFGQLKNVEKFQEAFDQASRIFDNEDEAGQSSGSKAFTDRENALNDLINSLNVLRTILKPTGVDLSELDERIQSLRDSVVEPVDLEIETNIDATIEEIQTALSVTKEIDNISTVLGLDEAEVLQRKVESLFSVIQELSSQEGARIFDDETKTFRYNTVLQEFIDLYKELLGQLAITPELEGGVIGRLITPTDVDNARQAIEDISDTIEEKSKGALDPLQSIDQEYNKLIANVIKNSETLQASATTEDDANAINEENEALIVRLNNLRDLEKQNFITNTVFKEGIDAYSVASKVVDNFNSIQNESLTPLEKITDKYDEFRLGLAELAKTNPVLAETLSLMIKQSEATETNDLNVEVSEKFKDVQEQFNDVLFEGSTIVSGITSSYDSLRKTLKELKEDGEDTTQQFKRLEEVQITELLKAFNDEIDSNRLEEFGNQLDVIADKYGKLDDSLAGELEVALNLETEGENAIITEENKEALVDSIGQLRELLQLRRQFAEQDEIIKNTEELERIQRELNNTISGAESPTSKITDKYEALTKELLALAAAGQDVTEAFNALNRARDKEFSTLASDELDSLLREFTGGGETISDIRDRFSAQRVDNAESRQAVLDNNLASSQTVPEFVQRNKQTNAEFDQLDVFTNIAEGLALAEVGVTSVLAAADGVNLLGSALFGDDPSGNGNDIIAGLAGIAGGLSAIHPAFGLIEQGLNIANSLLGDLSNGARQVRMELEGMQDSFEFVNTEEFFKSAITEVNRGGIFTFLPFLPFANKKALDPEEVAALTELANDIESVIGSSIDDLNLSDLLENLDDQLKEIEISAIIKDSGLAEAIAAYRAAVESGNQAAADDARAEIQRVIDLTQPKLDAIADRFGEEVAEALGNSIEDFDLSDYFDNLNAGIAERQAQQIVENSGLKEAGEAYVAAIESGNEAAIASAKANLNTIIDETQDEIDEVAESYGVGLTTEVADGIIQGVIKAEDGIGFFNQNLEDSTRQAVQQALLDSFLQTEIYKEFAKELGEVIDAEINEGTLLEGGLGRILDFANNSEYTNFIREFSEQYRGIYSEAGEEVKDAFESVFNSANSLKEFGKNLNETANENLEDALFEAVTSTAAYQALSANLTETIERIASDGVITDAERQQFERDKQSLFDLVEDLGIYDTVSKLNRSFESLSASSTNLADDFELDQLLAPFNTQLSPVNSQSVVINLQIDPSLDLDPQIQAAINAWRNALAREGRGILSVVS